MITTNRLFSPQSCTIFRLKKVTITKITRVSSRRFPFVGRCLSRAIRVKWRTLLSLTPTRHSLDATCQPTPAMYQLNAKTLNEININGSRNKVSNCSSRRSKMGRTAERIRAHVGYIHAISNLILTC